MSYVKNTVAYYRQKLDRIMLNKPQYIRASSGYSTYTFIPDLNKSFNRGFTKYFLNNRTENIWSLDSPKSMGEKIGVVTEVTTRYIRIRGDKGIKVNNGDGLCFLNHKKEMEGIQVNRVEGDCIYPFVTPEIKKGTLIYRNFDHEFEKTLSKKSSERKVRASIEFDELPFGYSLSAEDEDGNCAVLNFDYEKQLANKDQTENIQNNLKKTGNTIFYIEQVLIKSKNSYFIPASILSDWRRLLIDKLLSTRKISNRQETAALQQTTHPYPLASISYLGNVMNDKSKLFYEQHGAKVMQPAFEKEKLKDVALMFTRHCIKYSLGWCPKEKNSLHPYKEPFYLVYNNTKLRLSFDCKDCEMKVYQMLHTE